MPNHRSNASAPCSISIPSPSAARCPAARAARTDEMRFIEPEGVRGSTSLRERAQSIAAGGEPFLVRNGDVARRTLRAQAGHGLGERVWRDVERLVGEWNAGRAKRRVLEPRRERV